MIVLVCGRESAMLVPRGVSIGPQNLRLAISDLLAALSKNAEEDR
jgi:hypothetical protein